MNSKTKVKDNLSFCHNHPDFAVICSFIQHYGELLKLPHISFPYLQRYLEDTKTVAGPLIDLYVKLLRPLTSFKANTENWEQKLGKFCKTYSSVDYAEFDEQGYKNSKLETKLRFLKTLLEASFDNRVCYIFKRRINEQGAKKLRLLPIGRDKDGRVYWYLLDKDCNMLLYREKQDDMDSWQLVSSDRSELADVIYRLKYNELVPKIDLRCKIPDSASEDDSTDVKPLTKLQQNIKQECPDEVTEQLQSVDKRDENGYDISDDTYKSNKTVQNGDNLIDDKSRLGYLHLSDGTEEEKKPPDILIKSPSASITLRNRRLQPCVVLERLKSEDLHKYCVKNDTLVADGDEGCLEPEQGVPQYDASEEAVTSNVTMLAEKHVPEQTDIAEECDHVAATPHATKNEHTNVGQIDTRNTQNGQESVDMVVVSSQALDSDHVDESVDMVAVSNQVLDSECQHVTESVDMIAVSNQGLEAKQAEESVVTVVASKLQCDSEHLDESVETVVVSNQESDSEHQHVMESVDEVAVSNKPLETEHIMESVDRVVVSNQELDSEHQDVMESVDMVVVSNQGLDSKHMEESVDTVVVSNQELDSEHQHLEESVDMVAVSNQGLDSEHMEESVDLVVVSKHQGDSKHVMESVDMVAVSKHQCDSEHVMESVDMVAVSKHQCDSEHVIESVDTVAASKHQCDSEHVMESADTIAVSNQELDSEHVMESADTVAVSNQELDSEHVMEFADTIAVSNQELDSEHQDVTESADTVAVSNHELDSEHQDVTESVDLVMVSNHELDSEHQDVTESVDTVDIRNQELDSKVQMDLKDAPSDSGSQPPGVPDKDVAFDADAVLTIDEAKPDDKEEVVLDMLEKSRSSGQRSTASRAKPKLPNRGKPSAPIGPIIFSNIREDGVTLSWQSPKVNGGTLIKKYLIEKMRFKWSQAAAVYGNILTCDVQQLAEGKRYKFRVFAINSAGYSKPLLCTDDFIPRKPTGSFGGTALPQDICSICGDRSSGKHYNVYSCQRCSSFFKRTFLRDLRYTCHYEKDCRINAKQKSGCQYCRYMKCLSMGMRQGGPSALDMLDTLKDMDTSISHDLVPGASSVGDGPPSMGDGPPSSPMPNVTPSGSAITASNPESPQETLVNKDVNMVPGPSLMGDGPPSSPMPNRTPSGSAITASNPESPQKTVVNKDVNMVPRASLMGDGAPLMGDSAPSSTMPNAMSCESTISTEALDSKDVCAICGDGAFGKCFGVYSCHGCNSFAKRTFGKHVMFTCAHDKNCLINAQHKSVCKYCRYMKCLSAGMKRGGSSVMKTSSYMDTSISHNMAPEALSVGDAPPSTTVPDPMLSLSTLSTASASALPETETEITHLCVVCGDGARGKHFGVYSCPGCKGFVKRTFRNNLTYECLNDKNCAIEIQHKNACKYCRYMKCLSVGMKRKDTVDASNGIANICAVCGDHAHGKRFGVYSCPGCKGFVKRTISNNLTYECLNDKNCAIVIQHKNACKYCRYMKCLSVGMKRKDTVDASNGIANICAVCGDHAHGKRFGVYSCPGCKGFVKRTISNNLTYECLNDKNCAIVIQHKNACKYCRYMKCLSVGMKRKGTVDASNGIANICAVCGDHAHGKRFGVYSCSGCKSFANRTVGKNMRYESLCDRKCIIDVRHKNVCKYCRYLKCLSAGMIGGDSSAMDTSKNMDTSVSHDVVPGASSLGNGPPSSAVANLTPTVTAISTASNTDLALPEGSCTICGGIGLGKCYGVYSCKACMCFMKRTVCKDLTYICRCRKNCCVDVKRKSKCRYCRYMKCLSLGMNRAYPVSEGIDKTKLTEKRRRRAEADLTSSTSDSDDSDSDVSGIKRLEMILANVQPKLGCCPCLNRGKCAACICVKSGGCTNCDNVCCKWMPKKEKSNGTSNDKSNETSNVTSEPKLKSSNKVYIEEYSPSEESHESSPSSAESEYSSLEPCSSDGYSIATEDEGDKVHVMIGRNACRAADIGADVDNGVVEDAGICYECEQPDRPEWIMLCDKCDAGYHTACLRPPLMIIPEGDWYCPPCEHKMLIRKLTKSLKDLDEELKRISKQKHIEQYKASNTTNSGAAKVPRKKRERYIESDTAESDDDTDTDMEDMNRESEQGQKVKDKKSMNPRSDYNRPQRSAAARMHYTVDKINYKESKTSESEDDSNDSDSDDAGSHANNKKSVHKGKKHGSVSGSDSNHSKVNGILTINTDDSERYDGRITKKTSVKKSGKDVQDSAPHSRQKWPKVRTTGMNESDASYNNRASHDTSSDTSDDDDDISQGSGDEYCAKKKSVKNIKKSSDRSKAKKTARNVKKSTTPAPVSSRNRSKGNGSMNIDTDDSDGFNGRANKRTSVSKIKKSAKHAPHSCRKRTKTSKADTSESEASDDNNASDDNSSDPSDADDIAESSGDEYHVTKKSVQNSKKSTKHQRPCKSKKTAPNVKKSTKPAPVLPTRSGSRTRTNVKKINYSEAVNGDDGTKSETDDSNGCDRHSNQKCAAKVKSSKHKARLAPASWSCRKRVHVGNSESPNIADSDDDDNTADDSNHGYQNNSKKSMANVRRLANRAPGSGRKHKNVKSIWYSKASNSDVDSDSSPSVDDNGDSNDDQHHSKTKKSVSNIKKSTKHEPVLPIRSDRTRKMVNYHESVNGDDDSDSDDRDEDYHHANRKKSVSRVKSAKQMLYSDDDVAIDDNSRGSNRGYRSISDVDKTRFSDSEMSVDVQDRSNDDDDKHQGR